jgi:hypothetical protein
MNCTDEELATLFSDWKAQELNSISPEREARALAQFKRALEKEPVPEKSKGVAVGETMPRRRNDAGFGFFPLIALLGAVADLVLYTLHSTKVALNALGTAKLVTHGLRASMVLAGIIGTGLHGPALRTIKNWASARPIARRSDSPVPMFVVLSGSTNSTTLTGPAYWLATGSVDINQSLSLAIDPPAVATVIRSGDWSNFVIARAVMAMHLADTVYGSPRFEPSANFYLIQLRNAQQSAPFGDGLGLVGATLQTERWSIPVMGYLPVGRDGVRNRFDAVATAWAALADQGVNP